MLPVMRYGETARPWDDITDQFDGLAAGNAVFCDLAVLARQIGGSPFPAAGLHGLTSMHDILIGPSPAVMDNPFLRIAYDFAKGRFVLTFRAWRRSHGITRAAVDSRRHAR